MVTESLEFDIDGIFNFSCTYIQTRKSLRFSREWGFQL